MHPGRPRDLREEHRAELAGTDEADPDRIARLCSLLK
jgi:hypothetical protein